MSNLAAKDSEAGPPGSLRAVLSAQQEHIAAITRGSNGIITAAPFPRPINIAEGFVN